VNEPMMRILVGRTRTRLGDVPKNAKVVQVNIKHFPQLLFHHSAIHNSDILNSQNASNQAAIVRSRSKHLDHTTQNCKARKE
jgi:hypothetical protein